MKSIMTLVMLGILLCAPSLNAEEQTAGANEPLRDEQVIIRLATMGQYLRGLKVFAVHADTTDDDVLENGQKLQFSGTGDYLVQAPDRIRLELKNDVKNRIYTYDGKTLTQYSPLLGYYASMEISGTIGKMILQAKERYDLDMPLADLFLWGTDKADTSDIKEAAFIGVERLNGHESEHFAFRQEGVDWQIWIQAGAKPLPDKLVITASDEPAQPSYTARLKWNLTPKPKEADFKFIPPKGAAKIAIVAVDPAIKQ